jgi:hypothetical protein
MVAITGIAHSFNGTLPEGLWNFSLRHVLTFSFTHALCYAPVPKRPELEDNTPESESHHQYLSPRQVDMDCVERVLV